MSAIDWSVRALSNTKRAPSLICAASFPAGDSSIEVPKCTILCRELREDDRFKFYIVEHISNLLLGSSGRAGSQMEPPSVKRSKRRQGR